MQHHQAILAQCPLQSGPGWEYWLLLNNKINRADNFNKFDHDDNYHKKINIMYIILYTSITKSKLPTHYSAVRPAESIITHSSPLIVVAKFHSAFINVVPINESDITLSASLT